MTNKQKKEDLPGLTFYTKEKELKHCAGKKFKATGSVTLRAEIQDLGLWEPILDKLDGMVVYTVNDLADCVVQAAQRRADKAESTAMKTMEDARRIVDALEARNSFLESDNANVHRQLHTLVQERDELQEVVSMQDAALQQR